MSNEDTNESLDDLRDESYLSTDRRRFLQAAGIGAAGLTALGGFTAAQSDGFLPDREIDVGDDPAILVVSLTPGYRHESIEAGNQAIQELGDRIADMSDADEVVVDIIDSVDDGAPPTEFPSDVSGLEPYDVIVFNSSNDANAPDDTSTLVLDDDQADAFEQFIRNDGGTVGIHSSIDNQTQGSFFNNLFATYFEGHPATQDVEILVEDRTHPSTAHLPEVWEIHVEPYNFLTNPRGDVNVLASFDETSYHPYGEDDPVPADDHPMTWYQYYEGGRSWYTALGHFPEQFSDDEDFRDFLLGGIMWAAGYVTDGTPSTYELEAVSVDTSGSAGGRSEYVWEDGTGGVTRGPPAAVCDVAGGSNVWIGVTPEGIADVTNPTLTLVPGRTYTIEWTNTGGQTNNFVIVDDEGNELVSSEDVSEAGETQTLEFVATEEMAEYYSGTNPTSQRGDIEIHSGRGFELTGIDPASAAVTAGDALSVSVDLTNAALTSRTQTVTLWLDGERVGAETRTLDAGADATVTFDDVDTADLDPGEYTYTVTTGDTEVSGTLTVESAPTGDVNLLIFSATAGFRHGNIEYGQQRLQEESEHMADELGVDSVTIDTILEDASEFPSDASELAQYDAIVWLNTTGNALSETDQREAFEEYMANGGGYVGIHSAADTHYSGEGEWPFYVDMLGGATFVSHPSNTDAEIRVTDRVHPSTEHLPERWEAYDEWYNYAENPRGDVHVLATLDEDSYDLEGTGGMGEDHPIAWAQEYEGGRAWYTGRGHTEAAFDEQAFVDHVIGGIGWAAGVLEGDATGTVWDAFEKDDVVTGLTDPTTMAVADDGRLFFTHGHTTRESPPGEAKVSVYSPDTDSVSEVMSFEIYTGGNTGLFGLELDPDFEDNGWVYLQYAPVDEEVNRVSRFTYEDGSIDPGSEQQLLDVDVQRIDSYHAGGVLQFGPEGDLYIATGDDTNPFESSGYAPIDERDGRQIFDAQRSSANTNDLRGSILRITPTDDGGYEIPDGNLLTGPEYADARDQGLVREEIYVMGLRNPFKMHVDEETGALWYSDYGPDAGSWDPERGPPGIVEFTRATEPHFAGWPYFTGPNVPYVDYDFETDESGEPFDPQNPINDSPNNTGLTELPPAREPTIYYPRNWNEFIDDAPAYADEYVPDENPFPELPGGGAPHAGPVYRTDEDHTEAGLPEYYDGKHFMLEYGHGWTKYATFDDDGEVLDIEPFLPNEDFGRNWEMEVAPDGSLYHMDFGGTISRITAGEAAATATASFTLAEDSLEPEGSTTGTVTVTNVSDSELTALSFSVTAADDAVAVAGPSQTDFDSLAPGESQSVEYDVTVGADATAGSYDLDAEVSYTHDGEGMVAAASTSVTVSTPQAADQYFWQASDHETGDQPDSWEPMANVGSWGVDEDDDGLYLGLEGPASQRTSLRYAEPDGAVEMEVWALAKAVDPAGGDYWVYGRGYDEDQPQTGLTAARADDFIVGNEHRVAAYDGGSLEISGETVPHVGANELYEVRLQVSGDTMRAKWWLTGDEEPDEWDLERDAPTEAPGYAGLGHWTGEPYQLYAMGVGVGGAEAPTSELDDQFIWSASDHETGDQPDSWEPMANVGSWGVDEDDDGLYLGLDGPASQRTSLRYAEPDAAAEMEVLARAKAVDPAGGDYWVYARGFDEDQPNSGLTAARADDFLVDDQHRLTIYDGGDINFHEETIPHVGANEVYDVRIQVSGDTYRARWWLAGEDEPDEWDLERDAPTEAPGYAGIGHWTGAPYQLYALSVGLGGAGAPALEP